MSDPSESAAGPLGSPLSLARRAAGILLHPTSLPGGHGIGDLGESSRTFVEFLARAGITWWQMLPVGPAGIGDSPYQSPSAFAGNPLLIELGELVRCGWLSSRDLDSVPANRETVDFDALRSWKAERLRTAHARFEERATAEQRAERDRFLVAHRAWLPDYALFEALREVHGSPWTAWPPALRDRDPIALAQARSVHAALVARAGFEQWVFDRQWASLREACAAAGVGLIGDVPIYVAHDSADVWANREWFQLEGNGAPAAQAGVPPDLFSESGQLWENPLYDWRRLADDGFAWWHRRLVAVLARFDVARLDHFIGFERFWAVPSGASDARHGRWRKGPGAAFFKTLPAAVRQRLIAEDLGVVTPAVEALRERFDLPGMRVLQFGLTGEAEADDHLPHRYPSRCVAYSTTHDFDTLAGWLQSARPESRDFALAYVNSDAAEFHRAALRVLWISPASLAVVPLQDVLGLGSEARTNRPGTRRGNWRWRCSSEALRADTAEWLRSMGTLYGRSPERRPS